MIAPVVDYSRLREVVEKFVGDLRAVNFATHSASRQLLMYRDYMDMLGRLEVLEEHAIAALQQSLAINSQDEARQIQPSASGSDGASGSGQQP